MTFLTRFPAKSHSGFHIHPQSIWHPRWKQPLGGPPSSLSLHTPGCEGPEFLPNWTKPCPSWHRGVIDKHRLQHHLNSERLTTTKCPSGDNVWNYSWFVDYSWRRSWQPTSVFCLENPMDRGAWWAAIHEVAELDMTEQPSTAHWIFGNQKATSSSLFVLKQNDLKLCY